MGKDNHAIMFTKHLKPAGQFSSYHIYLTMHQWINLSNELWSRRFSVMVTLQYIDFMVVNAMANLISFQISKFDSSETTSVSLAIEYKYNCSEQHYCHSTCRGYTRMMSQRRSGSRGTRSNDADGGRSADYISEDQASRYCSVSDKDTFKQTMTLQILFPSE